MSLKPIGGLRRVMADCRVVCDSSCENPTTNGRRPLSSNNPCGFQLPSYAPMLATILGDSDCPLESRCQQSIPVDSNCPLVNLNRRVLAAPARSLRDSLTGSDLCRGFHHLLRFAVILKWRLLYNLLTRE